MPTKFIEKMLKVEGLNNQLLCKKYFLTAIEHELKKFQEEYGSSWSPKIEAA
jgi:hypothetical protein